MKKIISILMAAVMVLAFAACGNNSGNNGGNDAAVTDPLEVLTKAWEGLSEDEKFPAAGGDATTPVDGAPGKFDISDVDNLSYMLSFPAESVDLIDSAASLTHMMNMNHQNNWDTQPLLLSHKNCQNSVLFHYMFCIYHFQDTDDNVFPIGCWSHLLH